MYANHNLDFDKRSSIGQMSSSKLRSGDITTSKKHERPAANKAKVHQKYPLRSVQNVPVSQSPRQNSPHTKAPASKSRMVIPLSASQSKADTLKLLQEQMRMLERWKNGQLFDMDVSAKRANRSKVKGTVSTEKTLDTFPTKIKSNINLRKADPHNLMQQSWPRLQTCYEDCLESPTAPRNSVNTSVSLEQFSSDFSTQMAHPPEKEPHFATTISHFVDILDIKSNVNNNKQTTTDETACESSSTQTVHNSNNMLCQVCARVSNMSTQMVSDQETEQNGSGLEETIVEDCDNLLRTLKMHDCRQNVNQIFGTPTLPNFASGFIADKVEFGNVLEGLFNFHHNLPEESILQFRDDVISTVSECNVAMDPTENVIVESSKPEENVNVLLGAIQNSNRLISELNSLTTVLQHTFQSIVTSNAEKADETRSDYKTVDPGQSQSSDIISKDYSEMDKTEYMPVPKPASAVQLPDVNLEKIIYDLDSAVLEINEDIRNNQIKSSIANISSELVKILRQMKFIGGQEQNDCKNSRMQSSDRAGNLKVDNRRNQSSRKSKSNTDILLPYDSKKDWDVPKLKNNVRPKSSEESVSSNFSTCTELSFAEFTNFESPMPKHGTGDHVFSSPVKVQRVEVSKVLSNVSTNTDDIDSISRNYNYVRYKPLLKSAAARRPKRRRQSKMYKTQTYVKPITTTLAYQMSAFHPTFATKSALKHFPNFPNPSKNRKLIVLSQTPSVGDLKYTTKECNKDSAILVQSSTSCEYDGANNTNLLSINSSHHRSPMKAISLAKTGISTPYPETTLVIDTSNVTLAEDISLSDMNKLPVIIAKKSCEVQACAQIGIEAGVQKDVPLASIQVQGVERMAHQDAAVQNRMSLTDKDISTDILDSKSIDEEPAIALPIESTKQVCIKKSLHVQSTEEEYATITEAPSTIISLPKFNKKEIKLDFGSELVCAVKEKCSQMPKQMVQTVLTRLQATFNVKLPEDMSNLQCHLTNYAPPVPGFEILSVRCIGDSSVLIKWKRGPSTTIRGYEVYINSTLKTKIHSSYRCSAVIDFIQPKSTLFICVCAMAEGNEVEQMAKATFKMI